MRIFRDFNDWPASLKGGVVVIGNFDGLHRGHLAVLEQAKQQSEDLAVPLIVMTFEPHPRRLFQPEAPELRLQSFSQKARQLKALGVDAILAQRFTRDFSQLAASAFMQQVLIGGLAAQCVMTGEDFIFGHQRSGHSDTLAAFAQKTGLFHYMPVAPVGNAGEGKFSSSKIREHLRQGEILHVNAMLGRPYTWQGRVIHGHKRGREMGFPTANIAPPAVMLPRFGVYAVRGSWDDMRGVCGVANIGIRPTLGEDCPLLEIHWFDCQDDLYGKQITVEWIAFLREEHRFDGLDALKAQIAQDCVQAKEILES